MSELLYKEIDFEYDLNSATDMKKLKLLAKSLESEFLSTAYREPKLDYFPKGKYLSYYMADGNRLYRYGVTKVWKERVFSNSCGNDVDWYMGNFSYYVKGDLINVDGIRLREFPPFFYKASENSDYIRMTQKSILAKDKVNSTMLFALKPLHIGGCAIENRYKFCIYIDGELVMQVDNVFHIIYNDSSWKSVLCEVHSDKYEMIDYYSIDVMNLTTVYLGTLHYQKPSTRRIYASYTLLDDMKQVDANNVYFYIMLDESKKSKMFYEYAKNVALIEKMDNEFGDDFTVNYKVTICQKDFNNIEFLWMLSYELQWYSIYGYELSKILCVAINNTLIAEATIKIELTDVVYNQLKEIVNKLLQKYNCDNDQLVGILTKKHGNCNVIENKPYYSLLNYRFGFHAFRSENNVTILQYLENKYKEKYNAYYTQLVAEGRISSKWISESEMFKLISNYYPDAIFQYRAEWLGFQSLDVFVPSIRTAFEYQGIQHYEPVEIFGGQDAFEWRKQLDEEKRKKCKDKNMKLVEWKFDEPLNKLTLEKKLNAISP